MGVDIVLLSSLKCYVVGMVVGSEHGLWSQMHGVQIPTAELGVSVSAWACYLIFFLSLFPQGGGNEDSHTNHVLNSLKK